MSYLFISSSVILLSLNNKTIKKSIKKKKGCLNLGISIQRDSIFQLIQKMKTEVVWRFRGIGHYKDPVIFQLPHKCQLHLFHHQLVMTIQDIGKLVRVFANGPGDLGSIPGRVIPKTQKMVLDTTLLNTQYYKVRIESRVKWSNPGKGVAPSSTPWCSSYRKGRLRVTLDNIS